MSHVFSLSMSPAVFAKSDKLNLYSLIYLTAQEGNSHGNYDELLLDCFRLS